MLPSLSSVFHSSCGRCLLVKNTFLDEDIPSVTPKPVKRAASCPALLNATQDPSDQVTRRQVVSDDSELPLKDPASWISADASSWATCYSQALSQSVSSPTEQQKDAYNILSTFTAPHKIVSECSLSSFESVPWMPLGSLKVDLNSSLTIGFPFDFSVSNSSAYQEFGQTMSLQSLMPSISSPPPAPSFPAPTAEELPFSVLLGNQRQRSLATAKGIFGQPDVGAACNLKRPLNTIYASNSELIAIELGKESKSPLLQSKLFDSRPSSNTYSSSPSRREELRRQGLAALETLAIFGSEADAEAFDTEQALFAASLCD